MRNELCQKFVWGAKTVLGEKEHYVVLVIPLHDAFVIKSTLFDGKLFLLNFSPMAQIVIKLV